MLLDSLATPETAGSIEDGSTAENTAEMAARRQETAEVRRQRWQPDGRVGWQTIGSSGKARRGIQANTATPFGS